MRKWQRHLFVIVVLMLSALALGCSSLRHTPLRRGVVFVGRDYQGEGLYVFPVDPLSDVTTNAFITITNVTTNVSFRVAVANGYSRPIFLETDRENFFRGGLSPKDFYDKNDRHIGFGIGSALTVASFGRIPCVYLLGRHGDFCGCTTYCFQYHEDISFTGPARYDYNDEPPTTADIQEFSVSPVKAPSNTTTVEMCVPACVTYYILGDPHRYTQEVTLPITVKRSYEPRSSNSPPAGTILPRR